MTTTNETAAPPPPPPPPPPPTRARLERNKTDRYVGGVCGGLGRYFNIDPVILRIGIAALAIFGGGLLIYAVAWAFLPEEGRELSIAQAARRHGLRGRELAIIALVVFAGLCDLSGDFGNGDGIGWLAPALLVAGFFWWRRDSSGPGSPPGPPSWPQAPGMPPAAPPAPSAFWAATATQAPPGQASAGQPYAGQPYGGQPPAAEWGRQAWGYVAPPPRAPKVRSKLGILTISAMLVLIGGAFILDDALGVFDLSGQGVLASALIVLGIGLLAGARFGRSRGLIALGLFLTLMLSAVSVIGGSWPGASGEVRREVTRVDQLESGYRMRAGSLTLDMTSFEFGQETRSVDVSMGFGEVIVLVPEGTKVRIVGHMGAGGARVAGLNEEGIDIDVDAGDALPVQLIINVRLGIGEIKVRNETS